MKILYFTLFIYRTLNNVCLKSIGWNRESHREEFAIFMFSELNRRHT